MARRRLFGSFRKRGSMRAWSHVARFDGPLYAITLAGFQSASLSVHIRNSASRVLPPSNPPSCPFSTRSESTRAMLAALSRNFHPRDVRGMPAFFRILPAFLPKEVTVPILVLRLDLKTSHPHDVCRLCVTVHHHEYFSAVYLYYCYCYSMV